MLAALMAFTCAMLQFLGAAGALGPWSAGFPGLSAEPQETEEPPENRLGVILRMRQLGFMDFEVSSVSLGLPSPPTGPLRLLAWLSHATAVTFATLAAVVCV